MPVAESEPLGVLIKRLRLSAGLSQEQLAERSGLSARAVSDLERGLRERTRPETLRMLAEGLALGVEEREALIEASRPELHRSPGPVTSASMSERVLADGSSPLIGREREVADIVSLLEGEVRLITLTGPGGVGKTRLAIEGARQGAARFQDGVVFVDLSTTTDFQLAPAAIARVLQLRDTGDRELRETLQMALRDRHMLLVLDNFEQVIDAAPVVGELVASALQLVVMVTSREALRVRGEVEVVIEPLALPAQQELADIEAAKGSAAVALFVQTAATVKPGFALTPENTQAVAEICRKLDGLPLAIELAATRVRHFPPKILLDHLAKRLPLLTGGPRDLPARQQTLRDTIAWSYDLLAPGEQALFRRLGIFAGGATIPAIEAVVPAGGELEIDVLSGLASLADKSLLREHVGHNGSPRFSMLELIREFALDRLAHAVEEERIRHSHSEWSLGFVRSWVGDFTRPTVFSFSDLDTIEGDLENIRAAVDYFDKQENAEAIVTMFVSLNQYFYLRGRFREGVSLGRRALQLAEVHPIQDELKGIALGGLAVLESMVGEAERGESLGRQGLQLARQTPENIGLLCSALISLLITIRDQGRYAEAVEFANEAFRLADAAGDRAWTPFVRFHLGKLAFLQDDLDRAEMYLRESLDDSMAVSGDETALYSANYLAAVYVRRGELEKAIAAFREVESLWHVLGVEFAGLFLGSVGALTAKAGRRTDAARIFGAVAANASAAGVGDLDEPWISDVKRDLRVSLGDDAFVVAYQEGQRLRVDELQALMGEMLDAIARGHLFSDAEQIGKATTDDAVVESGSSD